MIPSQTELDYLYTCAPACVCTYTYMYVYVLHTIVIAYMQHVLLHGHPTDNVVDSGMGMYSRN